MGCFTSGVPYALTLLLLHTCHCSVATQNYLSAAGRFGLSSGYQQQQPAPVFQDAGDYVEPQQGAQYPEDYGAGLGEPQEGQQRDSGAYEALPRRFNYTPTFVPNWPEPSTKLGQVSAVSLDNRGLVYVFHRGPRVWDSRTFDQDNRIVDMGGPPIETTTVEVFNASTGKLVNHWGKDLFYMPHGLTVDSENNVWVTDVGLHQVMKFSANDRTTPNLTLGVRFTPGNDLYHYCKPTAVAVMSTGEFFVSDGYCNSRIIKYSPEGRTILHWGKANHGSMQHYSFNIPHALALAEDKGLLCTADRENGRIMCYECEHGVFAAQYHHKIMGSRVFGVAYSPIKGGRLYVVNGPEMFVNNPVWGFVIDMNTAQIVSQFRPGNKDFSQPHAVAVSQDSREVYVVQLNPYKVLKFIDYDIVNEAGDGKRSENATQRPTANRTLTTVPTKVAVKPTATVGGWIVV